MIGYCVLECYVERRFIGYLVNIFNVAGFEPFLHTFNFMQFGVMIWIGRGFDHVHVMLSVNLVQVIKVLLERYGP